jgi:putative alpha-1,2-mannosidase
MRQTNIETMTNKQPVDWVDPLIDSANRRFFFLTTASHPFGMVNLSPDTRVGQEAWSSGYLI